MSSLHQLLGADGPLAAEVTGFAPRAEQQAMAEAVAVALEERVTLVVEAGTGTGKTFAYLVPALLSGRRVIISTGTRHLQDQLYHRDLPTVRRALGLSAQTALLKGRANYLCKHRLDLARTEGLRARGLLAQLEEINAWAGRTRSGDIAELGHIPEDSPLWPRVTSTTDNCLGQECSEYQRCHVVNARRAAQEADLVVINHHLLLADMALKEEGFGDLLPGADAFIIDEAHQLPETAAQFFGIGLGSRQLEELGRDTLAEHLREAGDMQSLPDCVDLLDKQVKDLRLVLGERERRAAWSEVQDKSALLASCQALRGTLQSLTDWLEVAAPRGKGLEACWRRAQLLLQRFVQTTTEPPADHVHWFETHRRSFRIQLTPLEVATTFQQRMRELPSAWIFTSATLAVGDSFTHFSRRMGLDEPRTLRLDSPFDYARNALLYHPQGLPDPNDPGYTAAVIDAVRPVLAASRGRAFLLFTSHRALQEAAGLLAGSLDYPLLQQGQAPRAELLDRFRELGNAVLLGTSSFWEGVDVRGEALSCVVIDKLPFASPGDPLLQARLDALRASGGNPFMEEQLPRAVITLKQGIGRLIRDVRDRGVLMLCDPRLTGKPYGKVFLNSFPPMRRSRELAAVEAFFAAETDSPQWREA
jgi:ATP-dependent DNA helicase DinG